ncbi:LacI family DNA-binding transcriptional regulator [Lacticaseibacillus absianus]|uniref:LacI family DNA-binding transcriptional regulator n=1 Tax=Lacticaseibacillus absianus TaxID=2729623 RepID=UPI0015CE7C61|nr:LacI family DNA-binding transcriptional regulator [Lacticaseibacillus absianus]
MPTIKDIATMTGVSIATVSRVLNNQGGYSEETREKVENAAREINYYRNEMAASLKKSSARIIGLIMPNAPTLFYGDIVEGIETVASRNNYSVIITHAGQDGTNLMDCVSLMAERRVEGLVIASMSLNKSVEEQIKNLTFPVVLVSTCAGTDIPFIKVDDESAAYDATNYLIEHGHQEIAIAGPNLSDQIAGLPRVTGYRRAMTDHGLVVEPEWIHPGTFSFDSGIAAMHAFYNLAHRPDAVFAVSDDTALGVMNTAMNLGLRVPEDLAVIGYDNTRIASMANPALTAVSQPFFEMGAKAVQKMIGAIDSGREIDSEILHHRIFERRSV